MEFGAALGKYGFAADAPRPGRVQIHVGEREAVPAIDHRRDAGAITQLPPLNWTVRSSPQRLLSIR